MKMINKDVVIIQTDKVDVREEGFKIRLSSTNGYYLS